MVEESSTFHGNISKPEWTWVSEDNGKPLDPVNDEILFYLELYLNGVATSFVSGFGIISNIINFVVFIKQKSSDCVSVCLQSLTITDFFAMLVTFSSSQSAFVKIHNPGLSVDPGAVLYLTQWGRAMCFDISMATTAFIAVERCLCVVMPFQFKHVFTAPVALCSLLAIYLFTIGSYLPVFVTHGFTAHFDSHYNKTRYVLWLSPDRAEIEKISNIFTHILVASIFQILVIICTYTMIVGLQRSSKFRHAMMTPPNAACSNQTPQPTEMRSVSALSETVQSSSRDSSLSDKNKHETEIKHVTKKSSVKKQRLSDRNKVISKMVSILTTIFIVCNFFRLAVVYGRRIYPDLSPDTYLKNSYSAVLGMWHFIGAFNCSVNIFVYYAYSPNYKAIFMKTFRHCVPCTSST